MNLKGVIFDLDGVLADTENLKAEAHSKTTHYLGQNVNKNLYIKVMGKSFTEVAKTFMEKGNLKYDDVKEITAQIYNVMQLLNNKGLIVRNMPLDTIFLANDFDITHDVIGNIRVMDLLFCLTQDELRNEPPFSLEKVYELPPKLYIRDLASIAISEEEGLGNEKSSEEFVINLSEHLKSLN